MSLLSRLAVQAARAYGILSAADKTKVVADYLVVAGGGGGGSNAFESGGGGGAGGLLTSTATLSTLNTYSVTVGAGGAGGVSGSNSVLLGTGLTTITSIGGGRGAAGGGSAYAASTGGSGGGGGYFFFPTGAAGTSGQGFAGGNGVSSTSRGGGGGGGSSSVGVNATISPAVAGNGGNGTASSISGSSVTYAGGGGGGEESGTRGTGQAGGGNGGNVSNNCTSATANSGSGGGGIGGNQPSSTTFGAGGSGIVIISYTSATPKFVGGTITTSGGKQIHTFTSSGTLSPITPITASYLVVAGGGGGGNSGGGGGGAGGYQTGSTTIYSGASYIVTVGGGGAATVNGSNSSLSGSGLTTITSTGGGKGGSVGQVGNSGGSGGGGGRFGSGFDGGLGYAGGAGTSGQGNAGGYSYKHTNGAGGGGGGAGAVGSNATNTDQLAGNGGAGTASSITGTSVTYAGGGGGGAGNTGSSNATGGAGGGGNGGGGTGGSGTANTGGGAGGGNEGGNGGSGGSGIVIISYAGSQAFNGGLVTSSGGNTIHTFTSTGALTPLTNNLNNSLRFRSSASAYLNRTPTLAGNRRTYTFSAWVKRGTLGSAAQALLGAGTSNTVYDRISFESDSIRIVFNNGTYDVNTSSVYRDPSAWYHVVVAMDTTQATAANRTKIYVNGNQITAFATASYPAQNHETNINNNIANSIGALYAGSWGTYFDGYMTDINFIDGQALEPYYFGNNDANGVWKPILYKGTYGTNGFYLTFGNTTSTTTLGYDSSPNGNNWTTNNISLTAGTTYDAMTDVPTNTSATVANYPTLNPLSNTSTLTEANLSASNILLAGTTMATPSTGKWYFEYTQTTSIPSGSLWVGVASNTSAIADNQLQGYAYASDGRKVAYNSYTSGYGATWTTGDVIGCALDLDNQTITFYKNNTSQGTAFTSITAQPYVFALSAGGAASTKGGSINCGQRPFAYTPPTGFVALNTYNLPTPTILQGNKYMDANLWSGDSTSPKAIVNQGQFKPDLVWVKGRNGTINHILIDSVRGTQKNLISNSTSAEVTSPVNGSVSSFNSNGFNVITGTSDTVEVNYTGYNYVGWQWQAGQGSTSSNTSGSITSTVSVNTTAGFSVVTYTGSGSNATVGHGLGVAPAMIITKYRGTESWAVYHRSTGNTQYLVLNATSAAATASTVWQNTSPTSTVFSVGTAGLVNTSGGSGMLAYCWAAISGFSAFGSYTGNGSTDGTFVYLGFRPKFVMVKKSNSTGSWAILDTARNPYNVANTALYADLSNAENSIYEARDYLSNGFKLRTSDQNSNGSGSTYIYAAFAENPFKNSNAR